MRPEPRRSDAPTGGAVTARNGGPGYRTELAIVGAALTADEPVAVGGTGLGPTPYELLAAGLAACKAMTARVYAERKGWPLADVTVRARYRKTPRDAAPRDQIDCELTLTGPLDETQRARLLEIAERCPVHRTLAPAIDIRTALTP